VIETWRSVGSYRLIVKEANVELVDMYRTEDITIRKYVPRNPAKRARVVVLHVVAREVCEWTEGLWLKCRTKTVRSKEIYTWDGTTWRKEVR